MSLAEVVPVRLFHDGAFRWRLLTRAHGPAAWAMLMDLIPPGSRLKWFPIMSAMTSAVAPPAVPSPPPPRRGLPRLRARIPATAGKPTTACQAGNHVAP